MKNQETHVVIYRLGTPERFQWNVQGVFTKRTCQRRVRNIVDAGGVAYFLDYNSYVQQGLPKTFTAGRT